MGIPNNTVVVGNDVNVYVLDEVSKLVHNLAVKAAGAPMTLATVPTVGSYTIVMNAGHTFANGDELLIALANNSFSAKVLSVATNTLTLDRPVSFAFPLTSLVFEVSTNMNVDGSVTVQAFGVSTGVSTTDALEITGIRLAITDNAAMDDSTFGGIPALTRGIVLRKVAADGSQFIYWNAKSNSELSLFIDNIKYSDKAPAGLYGVSFEWNIRDTNGSIIRLSAGDRLELLVQDNLTALASFKMMVYGHFKEV